MQLNKTQVIAIFLSAAYAQDPTDAEILNGPFTNAADGSKKIVQNTLKVCNGNNDCAAECPKRGEDKYDPNCGEKCASFQRGNTVDDMKEAAKNYCINKTNCGALGKIKGEAWSLQCWEDDKDGESASAPAKVENLAYINALDTLLQPGLQEGKSAYEGDKEGHPVWKKTDNLWISSRYSYQEGWWSTAKVEGEAKWSDVKWKETDKAVYNRCADDDQCAYQDSKATPKRTGDDATCCMNYPDANNLSCQKKSLAGKAQTIGPLTFTPQCESGWNNVPQNEEVGNAGDTIAQKALSEANENLKNYHAAQLKDAKTKAGYDKLSEEEKGKFDKAQEEEEKKRNELVAELKKLAKVDQEECKLDCQAKFEEELYKWYQSVYEICQENAKSPKCRDANTLKKKLETARAGAGDDAKNFYSKMTDEDRLAFAKTWDEEEKKEVSALAAAWVKANPPKEGEVGSACKMETLVPTCPTATHCCGTATPKDGAFVKEAKKNICVVRTSTEYQDGLGESFTFKCQEMAKSVAASVAATGVFAYSLM